MKFGPCEWLEWDTEFFRRRIARVKGHRLDTQLAARIREWAARNQVDCLYFLADDDPQTIQLAARNEFRRYDERLTFRNRLRPDASYARPADAERATFRPYRDEDLPLLRAIARAAHRDTRFYRDPCFADEECERLYDTWIYRSCVEGYADVVLVALMDENVVGYISCHLTPELRQGQIGLVAVSEIARGRGIGGGLLRYTLYWFLQQGMTEVLVVTQGNNVVARRLYERSGFALAQRQWWFHKWFACCEK